MHTTHHLTIGLGGGCHWCTEGVFAQLIGVVEVEQGWVASEPPHDAFSEAIRLTFDPGVLPPEVVIDIHLHTHAATKAHPLRHKYRSAVYYTHEAQQLGLQDMLTRLGSQWEAPLVTRLLPLHQFKSSPPRYRGYYRHTERPFCKAYIHPKLRQLLRDYRDYTDEAKARAALGRER